MRWISVDAFGNVIVQGSQLSKADKEKLNAFADVASTIGAHESQKANEVVDKSTETKNSNNTAAVGSQAAKIADGLITLKT